MYMHASTYHYRWITDDEWMMADVVECVTIYVDKYIHRQIWDTLRRFPS
jgi:hypothetical protein